jgi:hypothetical protein
LRDHVRRRGCGRGVAECGEEPYHQDGDICVEMPWPEAVPGDDYNPHYQPDPAGPWSGFIRRGSGRRCGAGERSWEAGTVEGEDAGFLLNDRYGMLQFGLILWCKSNSAQSAIRITLQLRYMEGL